MKSNIIKERIFSKVVTYLASLFYRITEDGDTRITEDGMNRILE